VGEVQLEGVRRNIGTFGHKTHVAKGTALDHLPKPLGVNGFQLTRLRCINLIEKTGKSLTKIKTPPAPMANIEDPLHLLLDRRGVVKCFVLPRNGMPGGRLDAAFLDASFFCHRGDFFTVGIL